MSGFLGLHTRAVHSLPRCQEGYTVDLDSWALRHEDGQQEGVAVGYTRLGRKPCHRPLSTGLGVQFIFVAKLTQKVPTLCRTVKNRGR